MYYMSVNYKGKRKKKSFEPKYKFDIPDPEH